MYIYNRESVQESEHMIIYIHIHNVNIHIYCIHIYTHKYICTQIRINEYTHTYFTQF